ncbi:MAG: 30S ribosomal protein S20 [Deltaproteobacteria bacterium]
MANHASALKRHRQSEKARLRNASIKSNLRTAVKRVTADISEGKTEDAKKSLASAISTLDSAASKGIIHKNNASKKISRLTKALNARQKKA